ncbi:MAG: hypothetical protein ACRD0V_11500 [Acidimicrobiales bacterium]
MLRRLVTWSYDRRRRVVALWLAAVVAASMVAGVAGGDTEADYTVPGSDSAEALELLQKRFPRFAGGTVDVVYTAEDGVTGPDTAARIDALAGDVAGVDHVLAAEPGPISAVGERRTAAGSPTSHAGRRVRPATLQRVLAPDRTLTP